MLDGSAANDLGAPAEPSSRALLGTSPTRLSVYLACGRSLDLSQRLDPDFSGWAHCSQSEGRADSGMRITLARRLRRCYCVAQPTPCTRLRRGAYARWRTCAGSPFFAGICKRKKPMCIQPLRAEPRFSSVVHFRPRAFPAGASRVRHADIPLAPGTECCPAGPSLEADVTHQHTVLRLAQSERRLRLRDVLCSHGFPLVARSGSDKPEMPALRGESFM